MENRIFLGRYRLSLGRDGLPVELHRSPTAGTFRAHEIESGREVALTLVAAPNNGVLLKRLQSEATAALEINQINIPRLYDFGPENGELIYVTEYCEGHTAGAWVAARGPLAIGAVLRVALQVVDAMNATAFQRLHHPALNPDNILFVAGQTTEGEWPRVKVLQWFAPAPDFSQTNDERIDSAARFAAPEQLSEGRIDVRSEIYSLGATMWFLLTGAPPASAAAGWVPEQGAANNLRRVPKIVRHLLDRMLSVNPDERPQDPVALASYLQTCLARVDRRGKKIERRPGLPLFARARAGETKTRPPIPLQPLAWAAGCLALVALAIVFLPWPLLRERHPTAVAPQTWPVPRDLPNDMRLTKANLRESGKRNASSASPVPLAARSPSVADGDREKQQLASTAVGGALPTDSPVPVVRSVETPAASPAAIASAEAPRMAEPAQPSATENDVGSSGAMPAELAAPGEGPPPVPAASRPALASSRSENEELVSPPIVTKTEEDTTGAALPPPVATATPATEEEAVARSERDATGSESALTKRTTTKRKAVSRPRPRESRRVAHQVKRARPLPKLRVGSSPAELVGTTSDGRWILSVSESGQRIIVPPPPGFER